jgi:hypothetical protein
MIKKILENIKNFFNYIAEERKNNINKPKYMVNEIFQENDEYFVSVQVSGKNEMFKARPEEILANDNLVDQFSQRDVRTLTYLGYLGINGPKYKILAKKLSKNEKTIFFLKKRGERVVVSKTADEIVNESDIIEYLNSEDAKLMGYTAASESIVNEEKQKKLLSKNK